MCSERDSLLMLDIFVRQVASMQFECDVALLEAKCWFDGVLT